MERVSAYDFSRAASVHRIRRVVVIMLAIALLALNSLAHASDLYGSGNSETPWSVLSFGPYLPDSTFNGGLYLTDNYIGQVNNSQAGRKIAYLSNGDVIVAGIASRLDGLPGELPINIVLTRYSANGARVRWPNAGENGYHFNDYVVFPNTADPTHPRNIKDVLDMKVFGNRIFILVDSRFDGGTDIDSVIHVFGTDGAYLRSTGVLYSTLPDYSGGMIIYGSGVFPETVSVAVVASNFDGVWRPIFRKGIVNSDSSITFNSPVALNPGNYCPSNRGCVLRSIARSGSVTGGPPTLYLAGTRQSSIPDNGNWDFLVMAVTPSGSATASFGGNGVTTVPFFEGRNNFNDANSIQVLTTGVLANQHDEIYVSGFVERECKNGVGIAKLKDDGSLDNTFGKISGANRTGKMVVGGAVPPLFGTCADLPLLSTSDTYSNGMVLADGKLALAGFTVKFNFPLCIPGQPCHEDDVDGTIAVIDTKHGDVDSFRIYPYTETVGAPRSRHSGFAGITESGGGSFTATGDVRFFEQAPGQPPGANKIATLRVRSDRIFSHDFE